MHVGDILEDKLLVVEELCTGCVYIYEETLNV